MTAHCSWATGACTSALIDGSRIVTADVLALTTKRGDAGGGEDAAGSGAVGAGHQLLITSSVFRSLILSLYSCSLSGQ